MPLFPARTVSMRTTARTQAQVSSILQTVRFRLRRRATASAQAENSVPRGGLDGQRTASVQREIILGKNDGVDVVIVNCRISSAVGDLSPVRFAGGRHDYRGCRKDRKGSAGAAECRNTQLRFRSRLCAQRGQGFYHSGGRTEPAEPSPEPFCPEPESPELPFKPSCCPDAESVPFVSGSPATPFAPVFLSWPQPDRNIAVQIIAIIVFFLIFPHIPPRMRHFG